ncbi:MAG TPA: sugar phosphate isomerase/epimerase family protein [Bryobacteraceae bacterium]|nr:sugar phosphate isomerase/epimerase family protein [Bryobacteraceae bacterium]
MHRRKFLGTAALAAAQINPAQPATLGRLPIKKAVLFAMLPKQLSVADRFQLAHDCGFEQIECPTTPDPKEAEEILQASDITKVRIHSVMNMDHWRYPLSSPDPQVVEKSLAGMRTSLHNARLWRADTVLLVPAVVTPEVSYRQAWERSVAQIRKLAPIAEELKVTIAIEEVWNKFLLSPLEYARYIDGFQSPWIRSYFDVGNVVLTGYPQDWIRTLGTRIAKLHIKDFRFRPDPADKQKRVAEFVMLREGDIDWKAVHQALAEIGYHGSATVELPGGDAPYLRDVSHRFDRILDGD